MSGFTDWYANTVLQTIAENAWMALHYDSPELDGLGGSEISGGGYHRVLIPFTMPSNRVIWSAADAIFVGLNSTRLTHFSINDSATRGHMYCFGELPEKLTVLQGKGYVLKQGDIAVSFA